MSQVNWTGSSDDNLSAELKRQLSEELQAAFGGDDDATITATRQFRGYSWEPRQKIVLGVEVRHEKTYYTHIVKLGHKSDVADDYDGWQRCTRGQNFASRILMRLRKHVVANDRAVIVYQDAYSLFGDGPKLLEDVVTWAVTDSAPEPASVERAIYQIFTDLNRWCYRHGVAGKSGGVTHFYNERLKNAIDRWAPTPSMDGHDRRSAEFRWTVRRDATWLFRGIDPPDPDERLLYLDPHGFVQWALSKSHIPDSLLGRSHGDLHGRNILVGVERQQVDYPALFDYGEMGETNVIAWDFAKLETELKVRLLPKLYEDEEARHTLIGEEDAQPIELSMNKEIDRKQRLQFCFEVETRLAELTRLIDSQDVAESMKQIPSALLTKNNKVDRMLVILLRIRKEAALWLGFKRQRNHEWLDELFFCLTVYGLCSSKWKYTDPETLSAVVSAGVAAANVLERQYETEKVGDEEDLEPPYPSYRVPLLWAYKKWEAGESERATTVLSKSSNLLDYAVPLRQAHALILAETGRLDEAGQMLKSLEELCIVFRDHEALSRLGRIAKDAADKDLELQLARNAAGAPVTLQNLQAKALPAWQLYGRAFESYKKAFDISNDSYPGVNAATLAFFIGDIESAKQLARRTRDIAKNQKPGSWVFATEAETCLLTEDFGDAVDFYASAIQSLGTADKQNVQSMYKQVCRLWWAFGRADKVDPVVKVFRQWEKDRGICLEPGPLGDCGRQIQK